MKENNLFIYSVRSYYEITANGSLLPAVVAVAFCQLKCREKDEKRDTAEWLIVSRYGSKHLLAKIAADSIHSAIEILLNNLTIFEQTEC